jgi:DNA-binding transcriptional LysR family regulator
MDIELARTFLAIVETGNFYKAAESLNVTQSTVSMRIKSLEEQLGRPVFVRSKAGATPTAAGRQFLPYATSLVRVWQQARQEVALPRNFQAILNIGGQFTLWERLLLKWIPWLRTALPEIAVRAEVGLSDGLMRRLVEGTLDIGVMYTPQSRPGLVIDELMVEHLILVATAPDSKPPYDSGYIYVDWGPEFLMNHSRAFPDLATPALSVSHGPLAFQYLRANGGSGYFPIRIVRQALADGAVFAVESAPRFTRPVYAVYPTQQSEQFKTALQGLRYVASQEAEA